MSMEGFAVPPEMVKRIVREMAREANSQATPPKPKPIQARVLKDMLFEVSRACPFKPGDLVEQVPAYSRYKWPADDCLALVTDVGPFHVEADVGDPVDQSDMRILVSSDTPDGRAWAQFNVESWRFRKYEGEIE